MKPAEHGFGGLITIHHGITIFVDLRCYDEGVDQKSDGNAAGYRGNTQIILKKSCHSGKA